MSGRAARSPSRGTPRCRDLSPVFCSLTNASVRPSGDQEPGILRSSLALVERRQSNKGSPRERELSCLDARRATGHVQLEQGGVPNLFGPTSFNRDRPNGLRPAITCGFRAPGLPTVPRSRSWNRSRRQDATSGCCPSTAVAPPGRSSTRRPTKALRAFLPTVARLPTCRTRRAAMRCTCGR